MIKLLAVDDEMGICNIIKKTFVPTGFTVFTANSGKEALAVVRKEKPHIVFLDIMMPGMNGLEALREIKKLDKTIKVIMVTVMDDPGTREEAKRGGAEEFVTKPFLPGHLEELVRKIIQDAF